MVSGGNGYYYYADALGSVRLITDAAGSIVESYTYDPYGRPSVMTAAGADGNWLTEDTATYSVSFIGNPYLFTGRRWDSSTGLYYYRLRDYSPALGRFLQPAPAGYIDGMNLYAYCGNNPLNRLDPWGLCKVKADLEKQKIIQSAKNYNKTSPRWGWNNQCYEQARGLYNTLPGSKYWKYKMMGGKKGFLQWLRTGGWHQHNVVIVIPRSKEYGNSFYIDAFKLPFGSGDVTIGNPYDFANEFPKDFYIKPPEDLDEEYD